MKKAAWLLVIVGVIAAIVAVRKQRPSRPKPSIWEKMQEGMEAMPADFPPRVMFDNVAAARENTDRILKMLEKSDTEAEPEAAEV